MGARARPAPGGNDPRECSCGGAEAPVGQSRFLPAVGRRPVIFPVRWLEMLVVGVFVYQHTGSAFDVALMTLLRSLPMTLFGAVIGALAERVDRAQRADRRWCW